jgi:LmbE family N-acetylglucosaminyl deacetylase
MHAVARAAARPFPVDAIPAPSIVFSPHQDDEVLGCGGMIAVKRAASADVSVVFLGDGTGAHGALLPATHRSRQRYDEARAATSALGVDPGEVQFLGLVENHIDDAFRGKTPSPLVEQLARVIDERMPDEVFVPSRWEPHADHRATFFAVKAALEEVGRSTVINEFPVWCWYHWPEVSLPLGSDSVSGAMSWRRELRQVATTTEIVARHGSMALMFRHRLALGRFRSTKLAALSEYRSQMTRFVDDPAWTTLGDVGKGDFLRSLTGEQEVFRRSMWTPSG